MKFMAIEANTEMDSGTGEEDFYQKCKLIYEKRFPAFGNFDDLHSCKEYLEEKPKYMSFRRMQEGAEEEKKNHPVGTKRAKQDAADSNLIKAALKEAGIDHDIPSSNSTGHSGNVDKVVHVLETFGNSVMSFWRDESDAKFVESLASPDRMEWKKEQFAIHLAKARLKRCQLEMSLEEAPVIPSTVNVNDKSSSSSSGGSNMSSIG